MILVTVGTHDQAFDRLVTAADELAELIDEGVVIQKGASDYEPRFAESFAFTSAGEMEALTREARVVIAHAAAGSILVTLMKEKPLIVVPRLQRHGEVIDDHQLELANALNEDGRAIMVEEPAGEALLAALEKIEKIEVSFPGATQLIAEVRKQLETWNI